MPGFAWQLGLTRSQTCLRYAQAQVCSTPNGVQARRLSLVDCVNPLPTGKTSLRSAFPAEGPLGPAGLTRSQT